MLKSIFQCLMRVVLLSFFLTSVSHAEITDKDLLTKANALFKPLPETAWIDQKAPSNAQIQLGRELFFETRVSSDGRLGCGACHNPAFYGADSLSFSQGVSGKKLPRNAPTVFNTALLVAQHYGGNRVSVEDQAKQALTSALAYGNKTYQEAEDRMTKLGYLPKFEKAFPGQSKPLSVDNWAVAIGAFERTLLTPAPFDRFLKGDLKAMSSAQKKGLDTFINTGCAGCHNGVTVGGQAFQKFGITADYWTETGSEELEIFKGRDKGRFMDTKKDEDQFIFKVSQLRNVAVTPPYFHDGSVQKLDDAVLIMGKLQLGKSLSPDEVASIVAFLGSLTGDIPKQFSNAPKLPVMGYKN